ncbi:MAG TPA: VWA domain-containing protein, partial [Pyrinomonadaceae bacterium]|nr:VWA domain-containing protein [Pyrinomonadaceae bacterium]
MKRLTLILLILFICVPGTLRAQSGRRQSDKGANSTSGRQPATDTTNSNPPDEEGMVNQGTGAGEVIEGDVLRVNTALVTVPVSVMDRNGKYVPDLGREDFKIFEEGVEQRLAYFATVDQPFTVALVLDTSGSTDFRLEDIQEAAVAFVNQLKPEDRVIVISFDDQINVLTKPTSDRNELIKAIRRTRTGGGTRLYDAVDLVIKKHLKQISGRKAMVLFTDGVDTTSRHASYDSTLREAEELDALIYPVAYDTKTSGRWGSGPSQIPLPGGRGGIILGVPFPRSPVPGTGGGGAGTSPADYQRGRMYLSELAQRTGGRLYNGGSMLGVSQAFTQIAEELRRQYSLGYYPKSAGQEGQRRRIKVRVSQPNLVVLARDSYIYSQ